MSSKTDTSLVSKIIKRYGPVIDLRANPQTIIDILRKFADEVPDGGQPCGGVPPSPPPGPSKVGTAVTNEDLMKAVLKLARDVNVVKGRLATLQKSSG